MKLPTVNKPPIQSDTVLPVWKPAGWTSFDVVNKIRRVTRIRKVGHAGTLDPFATGILLICLGRATKQVSQLMNLEKEYEAVIELGKETDTLDPEGTVVAEQPVPPISEERVKAVLQQFVGEIEQEIPAFSAAKFQGKRLYKMARKGQETPKLFKTVHIYSLELLALKPPELTVRTVCGRGTYVRALARDIARALGTVGYVKELVRTRVGPYTRQDAYTIEEIVAQVQKEPLKES